MHKQLIKEETTYLMLKAASGLKHIPTIVKYWACEDDTPVDGSFDFGDKEENRKYFERFERGELMSIGLIVEARALGECGEDSLWAIHVKTASMTEDLLNMAIEHDMKNNACRELKETILAKHRQLTEALE